jgi:hypothetical protein
MNIKDTKAQCQVLDAVEVWMTGMVDDFSKGNPKLQAAGVYIKNGIHNYRKREEEEIKRMLDNAALFVADHDGNVDMNKLLNDGMQVLREMDEVDYDLGLIRGKIGGGNIRVHLPDNFLVRALLGDHNSIVIGESDFRELKEILMG